MLKAHKIQMPHLVKRGMKYYIRRRIPRDLVEHYKRNEIQRSLRTSDPAKAAVACRKASRELDVEFELARKEALSGIRSEQKLDQPKRAALFEREEAPAVSTAFFEIDRRRAELRETVRAVLEEVGFLLPLRRVGINIEQQQNFPKVETALPRSPSTRSLVALVKLWEKERSPTLATVHAFQRTVYRFRELMGNVAVPRINRVMIVGFKDEMIRIGYSVPVTNMVLEHLSVLFNFAIGQAWIEYNPASRVRIANNQTALETKPRLPFDEKSLNSIFASRIYTAGYRPKSGAQEASYWLPLLGLFTGARIEELCQLRPQDIYEESYRDASGADKKCWVIRITDYGEGHRVKNVGSRRLIPLHSELIKRDFVKYVRSQNKADLIFPDLKANNYGRLSANWSAWWLKFIRAERAITSPRMVFHSFRHSFKDICRECGIDKGLRDALQGHSEGGAAGSYGAQFYPLRPLVEAMTRYRVSGVKLPI
jgi:integrase